VHFKDGILVVKGCTTIGEEMFASHLAKRLNISVPRTRVLEYKDSEWKRLKSKIFQLAESEGDLLKFKKELNRPVLLVMEYVHGIDFEHLGDNASNFFGGDNGKQRLQEVGRIISLDILTNNWDRLPVVWDNEGNLGNLFIQMGKDDGKVVGIDQGITCIHLTVNKAGYEKYVARVIALIETIVNKPTEESPQLKRVRDLIQLFTGFDITEKGSVEIQKGVMQTMILMAKLTVDDLHNMKADVQKKVKQDWESVWENMMQLINVEFFESILRIFRQYLPSMERALTKI